MKIKPKHQAVLANKKGFLSPSDKEGEIMGALNSQENSFSVYCSLSSHRLPKPQAVIHVFNLQCCIFSAFIFRSFGITIFRHRKKRSD